MAAESRLQSAIFDRYGSAPGVTLFRNNIGVARFFDENTGKESMVSYGVGGPGAPDLLVLLDVVLAGRCVTLPVWVETKAPLGRTRPNQTKWHAAAKANGWHCYFVRSLEQFAAILAEVRSSAAVVL